MMMDTRQALLQTILDEPDLDAPRLVFADWLEEYGEADRGEFIRLAVRLYRRGKARTTDPRDPDCERYYQLRRQHGGRWLEEMPRLQGVRWWEFWRGFPTVYVDHYGALKRAAARIWRVSPCEEVAVHWLSEPGGRFLGASPWLDRVRVLRISAIQASLLPGLRSLLKSPRLRHLRVLDLKMAALGDEGAKLLAACPHLTNLDNLWLEDNNIRAEGALALARTPHFPTLKHLDISCNPFFNNEEVRREVKARWGKHCC
jgi:uncharacterized protein (TIGR02996 family)